MREINCNLCGKREEELLFVKNGFNIVKCKNCGLVYVNPQPEQQEINKYYNEIYKSKREPTDRKKRAKVKEAMKIIGSIKRIVKSEKLKLLDIGCGFGYVLKAGKDIGWEVMGLDMAEWMVEYARKEFGVKAEVGKFPGINFKAESFDIITLLEVIEHLPDPSLGLKDICTVLKKGGYLIVRVPNIESFPAKKDGINWRGFV
ncbi:MAG TPA: class I SAM-dependent methyltransferase, partial [Candidatus Ratteibacteria bacterium]|nr:class I SAM-dependent methyltransferase [Candidatus Ratteibacteria bacterium]